MPPTKARVVGSGYTSLEYNGQPIAFLSSFTDSGQQPVAQSAEVHPLGHPHPAEIATARALSSGTINATIYELWDSPVWNQLPGIAGANTIVDVWKALDEMPGEITCSLIIRQPNGEQRGKTYHHCVITGIPDGETVSNSSMTVTKSITITYTHSRKFPSDGPVTYLG